MPTECCGGRDPLGVDWDEPELPVVGFGVGALDVLEVVEGGGELWVGEGTLTDGVVTVGVLTVGTLTDGVLTDGTVTDGIGNEDAADGSAIALSTPKMPAPAEAASNFLRLDTS